MENQESIKPLPERFELPKIHLAGYEFTQRDMGRVVSVRKLPRHRFWAWIEAKTGIGFFEQKYEVVIGNLVLRINQEEREELDKAREADEKVRATFGMMKTLGWNG